MNFLNAYAFGTCVYGGVRAMIKTSGKNNKMEVYNYQTRSYETRPFLLTEKVSACATGAVLGPIFFPIHLMSDIHDIELMLNGRLDKEKKMHKPFVAASEVIIR
jgi:coenzyme F420-reducing hydrogenase gamma subunit